MNETQDNIDRAKQVISGLTRFHPNITRTVAAAVILAAAIDRYTNALTNPPTEETKKQAD